MIRMKNYTIFLGVALAYAFLSVFKLTIDNCDTFSISEDLYLAVQIITSLLFFVFLYSFVYVVKKHNENKITILFLYIYLIYNVLLSGINFYGSYVYGTYSQGMYIGLGGIQVLLDITLCYWTTKLKMPFAKYVNAYFCSQLIIFVFNMLLLPIMITMEIDVHNYPIISTIISKSLHLIAISIVIFLYIRLVLHTQNENKYIKNEE